MIKNCNILYGVSGIGSGHTYRQLPIIEKLSRQNTVIVFAYGVSLQRYTEYFRGNPNVEIIQVAVPYYAGNKTGLDFAATAHSSEASGKNYVAENARAMDKTSQLIGKPDLVITDYEPVCAQYAYAYNAPLITIDQQSKYLSGNFPDQIAGYRFIDEVMRLRMFFPAAHSRIACSFFNVTPRKHGADVTIVPPVLRHEVEHIKVRRKPDPKTVLVYVTAQPGFTQSLEQIVEILRGKQEYSFHVFMPASQSICDKKLHNITFYTHGAPEFGHVLAKSTGVISTAGHSLLAEAMYLGVPVYAMPLPLYEQQMNADVIQRHGFGVSANSVEAAQLNDFLASMQGFARNIENHKGILLRANGLPTIFALIEARLQELGPRHRA